MSKIEVINSLKEAVSKKYDIVIWYLFHNHIIQAKAKIKKFNQSNSEIHIQPQGDYFGMIDKTISGFGTVNIYIPELSLVFSAPFKSMNDKKNLILGEPNSFLYHDRRSEDRTYVESHYTINFKLGKKEIQKKLHDISAGGMSIIFSKSERTVIPAGTTIKKIKLKAMGKTYELDCLVTNYLKLSPYMIDACPYGGAKVSFKFLNLNEKNSKVISKIITEQLELQKY
ncbi:MAG: PilZ domain-containing protein [Bacteriovoracaceae bacterium]